MRANIFLYTFASLFKGFSAYNTLFIKSFQLQPRLFASPHSRPRDCQKTEEDVLHFFFMFRGFAPAEGKMQNRDWKAQKC